MARRAIETVAGGEMEEAGMLPSALVIALPPDVTERAAAHRGAARLAAHMGAREDVVVDVRGRRRPTGGERAEGERRKVVARALWAAEQLRDHQLVHLGGMHWFREEPRTRGSVAAAREAARGASADGAGGADLSRQVRH